jgi:bile acid-coenzyme A ligase
MARAYQAAGARQGDIVALGLPNSVELIVAACAVWKAGATPLPLSWQLPEAERMGILETAQARLAVGVDRAPDGVPVFRAGFRPDPAVSDEDLPVLVAPAWKAATSGGSTGRPKVICSGTAAAFDLDAPDPLAYGLDGAMVMPGPLFHNGPFANTFLSLFRGNHVVLLSRFRAEETLAAVDRYRAHWLFMVPTMMYRIYRLPERIRAGYDLSSLRRVWHMSAPCAPWLKRAWIDWLGPDVVWELYSATEGVAMTVISGEEYLAHPGSVGRVVQGEISVRESSAAKPCTTVLEAAKLAVNDYSIWGCVEAQAFATAVSQIKGKVTQADLLSVLDHWTNQVASPLLGKITYTTTQHNATPAVYEIGIKNSDLVIIQSNCQAR